MNLALFGFMGVGKSEVGRILAERLGLDFTDLDDAIAERAGKTIAAIFEEDGEEAFREYERREAREVSARDGQVIACGGGTVLNEESLRNLRRSSVMILLTADPETILDRVAEDGSRPLLHVVDRRSRIRDLLAARRSRYLRAADLVVDTSRRTPEQVAEEIIRYLEGARRP